MPTPRYFLVRLNTRWYEVRRCSKELRCAETSAKFKQTTLKAKVYTGGRVIATISYRDVFRVVTGLKAYMPVFYDWTKPLEITNPTHPVITKKLINSFIRTKGY